MQTGAAATARLSPGLALNTPVERCGVRGGLGPVQPWYPIISPVTRWRAGVIKEPQALGPNSEIGVTPFAKPPLILPYHVGEQIGLLRVGQ